MLSVETLLQAAADFVVADLDLLVEPAAAVAAQRSLDDPGLLLLGETHAAGHPHAGSRRERAHSHPPHPAGHPDGRLAGPAAAGGAGDPH